MTIKTKSGYAFWRFWLVNLFVYLRHPRLCEKFHCEKGFFANVALPKTVEEKFLWRKIFDHNPLFTQVQDKLLVKAYARRILPDIGVAETRWVGTDLADAPKDLLEQPGVLKANHSCDTNVFLPEKTRSFQQLQELTKGWLARQYGKRKGEWAYRNIERKLFIEEMLENSDGRPLEEMKVHVAGGKTICATVIRHRYTEEMAVSLFRPDGSQNMTTASGRVSNTCMENLPEFAEGLRLAEQLGAGFDYIRVDLYVLDGVLYLGELTVYPLSGFNPFDDQEMLADWSRAWDLRQSWFLAQPQTGWRAWYAKALRTTLATGAGAEVLN